MPSRVIAAAAAIVLVVLGVVALVQGRGQRRGEDERAVLRVVRQGQRAALSNRPRDVCRLLTARARRNALNLDGLDQDPEGRRRRPPGSCAEAIGYQIDDARHLGELGVLRPGGYLRATRGVSIRGRRARVTKGAGVNATHIRLIKLAGGSWRADRAGFAPFDGSTGR